MSQNQTIDGVPRKSLEQALKLAAVFDDGGDGADAESARGVVWILRALLDAPAVSLADEGEMPAAQPQGEPVYMKPQYLSVPGLWIECKEGEIHAKPFYAEQPAPVSVVLPERKTWDGLRATACNLKGEAWNACLDELKRLNPSL